MLFNPLENNCESVLLASDAAYLKPSIFNGIPLILRNGYGYILVAYLNL